MVEPEFEESSGSRGREGGFETGAVDPKKKVMAVMNSLLCVCNNYTIYKYNASPVSSEGALLYPAAEDIALPRA